MGEVCLILKARSPGNAAGLELSEVAGSLCDTPVLASSARAHPSAGKSVVRQ